MKALLTAFILALVSCSAQTQRPTYSATITQIAVGKGPTTMVIADFNRDGKPDIAVANGADKTVTILLGDGKGGFTPAPGSPVAVLSYPHTHGVAAGDFNGDGKLDLVTESWGDDKVTVIFGDGHGRFASNHTRLARQPSQGVIAVRVGPDIHSRAHPRTSALVPQHNRGHFPLQTN